MIALDLKTLETIDRDDGVCSHEPWISVVRLLEGGYLKAYNCGHAVLITPKGYRELGYVPCDGAAHDNPHIDNCLRCAPRWGWRKP